MDIVKWEPFREMALLRREMNRLFGPASGHNVASPMEPWVPAVDILAEDDAITIKLELPEVDKKDVEINIQEDILTISGERKLEKEEKKEHYQRIERFYGSFSRSFTLPEYVDQKNISAESKDGVLRLRLPKVEPAKPQVTQIPIK